MNSDMNGGLERITDGKLASEVSSETILPPRLERPMWQRVLAIAGVFLVLVFTAYQVFKMMKPVGETEFVVDKVQFVSRNPVVLDKNGYESYYKEASSIKYVSHADRDIKVFIVKTAREEMLETVGADIPAWSTYAEYILLGGEHECHYFRWGYPHDADREIVVCIGTAAKYYKYTIYGTPEVSKIGGVEVSGLRRSDIIENKRHIYWLEFEIDGTPVVVYGVGEFADEVGAAAGCVIANAENIKAFING